MVLAVFAYGYGLVDLGGQSWKWLGAVIGIGAWAIAAITERLYGALSFASTPQRQTVLAAGCCRHGLPERP